MATDKPRFTITLDDELFAQVESYQHKNGISTRSKAVARLVARGMAETVAEVETRRTNSRETELLEYFDALDPTGQKKVITYAEDLVESGRYSKNTADKLA